MAIEDKIGETLQDELSIVAEKGTLRVIIRAEAKDQEEKTREANRIAAYITDNNMQLRKNLSLIGRIGAELTKEQIYTVAAQPYVAAIDLEEIGYLR